MLDREWGSMGRGVYYIRDSLNLQMPGAFAVKRCILQAPSQIKTLPLWQIASEAFQSTSVSLKCYLQKYSVWFLNFCKKKKKILQMSMKTWNFTLTINGQNLARLFCNMECFRLIFISYRGANLGRVITEFRKCHLKKKIFIRTILIY